MPISVYPRQIAGDRLLDQHVLAGRGSGPRHRLVQVVRQAEVYRLHILSGQRVLMIEARVSPQLLRPPARVLALLSQATTTRPNSGSARYTAR